ncbi:MAG: hypothetical protein ABIP97_03580 [Chthoniobacterales bacterium]
MNLTEDQKSIVSKWIADGVSLSDVQSRLRSELGVIVTYMEARILMTELNLTPVEKVSNAAVVAAPAADEIPLDAQDASGLPEPLPSGASGVKVTLDQIAKLDALISGKVTFSDGENAEWLLDSKGRLSLNPSTPGYRPAQPDVIAFQAELERAVSGGQA